jgi:hypothetical protein
VSKHFMEEREINLNEESTNIDPLLFQARDLTCKKFYSSNLQMLIISWNVFPWQAFPA